MDVDWENRNYYSYEGFGHLARNCRNRETKNRTGEDRRLEYRQRLRIEGNNKQDNLNGEENLVVLD